MTTHTPPTWHDRKPTHPIKPAWLIEVEQEQYEADKAYDDFVCDCLDGEQDWDDFILGQLHVRADTAYRKALRYRALWHQGSVPVALEIEAMHREGAEV